MVVVHSRYKMVAVIYFITPLDLKLCVGSTAYRLKKVECNCTPTKFKPCLEIVTVSTQ